jgi:endonuclease/exonuclease/phosphatase family metal-dependent hydrolase
MDRATSRLRSAPAVMRAQRMAAALVVLLVAGCGIGRNYLERDVPRYSGTPPYTAMPAVPDTLRIVSFNIEFAFEVDSAIAVLRSSPELKTADIVLLQEMDADATARVARALGMWYVFYPATFHFRTRRDFGNAVLARWPIVADAKLMLPNRSRYSNTLRTATAATVRIGNTLVRAYSTHLGTYADVDSESRAEQLRAVIADAEPFDHVVIAGDMNEPGVGRIARAAGYLWPTETAPPTSILGRLDHIYLKGFIVPDENGAGTVSNVRGASDHLPVWANVLLPY